MATKSIEFKEVSAGKEWIGYDPETHRQVLEIERISSGRDGYHERWRLTLTKKSGHLYGATKYSLEDAKSTAVIKYYE